MFCTLELITSNLCFKSLLAISFLSIKGCKRWIFSVGWNKCQSFLWALCVFKGAFLFITQVNIFVIKNTRYLGSFSPHLVWLFYVFHVSRCKSAITAFRKHLQCMHHWFSFALCNTLDFLYLCSNNIRKRTGLCIILLSLPRTRKLY